MCRLAGQTAAKVGLLRALALAWHDDGTMYMFFPYCLMMVPCCHRWYRSGTLQLLQVSHVLPPPCPMCMLAPLLDGHCTAKHFFLKLILYC